MELYINKEISHKKLIEMMERLRNNGTELHAFELYRGNELMVRAGATPYSVYDKRQMFSVSKSFTATAVAIAEEMGLLRVSDRVADIFKEESRGVTDSNLLNMTVENLLTMTTGHDECVMTAYELLDTDNPFFSEKPSGAISQSENGAEAFFKRKVLHKPGSFFKYNTGATYMLSAIITKLSGLTLLDFLTEKLFAPLDITPACWTASAGRINEGGIGLHISCDDLARFGLMYLNGGVYNGKRIISSDWVERASAPHSYDLRDNQTEDWRAGYGYQFWKCAKEGYRADGFGGQWCIIIPEKELVFAAVSESGGMQRDIETYYEWFDNCMTAEGEEADIEKTKVYFSELYQPRSDSSIVKIEKEIYKAEDNLQKITFIGIETDNSGTLTLSLSDGVKIHTVKAGRGVMIENSIEIPNMKPAIVALTPKNRCERARFVASWSVNNDKIEIKVRFIDSHFSGKYIISRENGRLHFELDFPKESIYREARKIEAVRIG